MMDWKDRENHEAYTPHGRTVSVRHTGLEYVVRAKATDPDHLARGGTLKVALTAADRAIERRS